jgi:glycoside/pentoside/hexuronide:cation symporter, GPH family
MAIDVINSVFGGLLMSSDASGLKVWQKVFYGLGDMTGTISFTIVQFLFIYYLTDVAGLAAALAGAVYLIGSFLQAVLNPVAGYLSDTARSRFGRRRIFFLATFAPYALGFFLLWVIPSGLSQLALFFIALAVFVFFIAVSVFYLTPYAAYSMELEGGYDGRTSLVAYRMFVSILLGLAAAVFPKMLADGFGGGAPGYLWMGLVFAVPLLFGPLFVFFARREAPFNQAPKERFWRKFRATFKNRHFVKALLIYVFTWVTVGFVQTFLIYYLKYVLVMEGDFELIVGVLMGVAVLALPLWVFISKKMDKRKAYILGVSVFLLFMLSLALPPDIIKPLIWVIVPFLGIGISCMHVMPTAIVPEAIELGSGKPGVSDQGTHFGVMNFTYNAAIAVVIQAGTALLTLVGYREATGGAFMEQPASAILAIRILVVAVPAVLLTAGIITAARFRIGRKEHAEYLGARSPDVGQQAPH